eukprot:TRINITY_DN5052_c0_g3_i1.p1 TRINITY_DN5052_c0_g3~~TRINITY_DN5052_c0_g3_i1.p1  ORF type:complete len:417 (+),score=122.42 TRINITY_DN5052_c0_g3_i1:78-1328(+)
MRPPAAPSRCPAGAQKAAAAAAVLLVAAGPTALWGAVFPAPPPPPPDDSPRPGAAVASAAAMGEAGALLASGAAGEPRGSARPRSPAAHSPGAAAACATAQLRWSRAPQNVTGMYRKVLAPTMFGDKWVEPFVGTLAAAVRPDRCLGPRDADPIAVDVGANLGQGLRTWLKLAPCENSTVIAVEPHPKTFKLLWETAKLVFKQERVPLDRLRPINRAAGTAIGTVRFYENYGKNSNESMRYAKRPNNRAVWKPFFSQHASLSKTHKYAKPFPVKMERVDHIIDRTVGDRHPILLLKTDTEGHDLNALKGSEAALPRVSVVMFEYHKELWTHAGKTLREAQEWLREQGFATFVLSQHLLTTDPPISGMDWDEETEVLVTGLGLRRGSAAACALRQWVREQALTPGCADLAEASLECG